MISLGLDLLLFVLRFGNLSIITSIAILAVGLSLLIGVAAMDIHWFKALKTGYYQCHLPLRQLAWLFMSIT